MIGGDTLTNVETLYVSDGTHSGTKCPEQAYNDQAFVNWQAWVPFNNSLYFRAAYRYWQWYDLCRLTLEPPSGISELPHQNLSVYPNPTNSTFKVVLPPSTSNADIEVYDNRGVLIYRQTNINALHTVDLGNRSPGIYILKIISNNRFIAVQKIIKE
jgi:hypothetical protein